MVNKPLPVQQVVVKSNCIKECKADAARKGCISCGRSMEEITLAGLKRKEKSLEG